MSPAMRFTTLVTLISFIPIGWHFGTVFELWGSAPETRVDFFIRIGIIVIGSIVASIIGAIITTVLTGKEDFEPDEREALVLRKAELAGYYSLAACICYLMWRAFDPLSPMQIANALLAAFTWSEFVKLVAGFVLLRRGV